MPWPPSASRGSHRSWLVAPSPTPCPNCAFEFSLCVCASAVTSVLMLGLLLPSCQDPCDFAGFTQ